MRLPEDDVPLTSFRTPLGLFAFKVLPFGLRNAPQTFQAVMNNVLQPLSVFCLVYMDDVLVFSETPAEHIAHVRAVLERLRSHRLFAKPRKCHWGRTQLRFLGHMVSDQGLGVDPSKVAAVQKWPAPLDVSQVRSFLGLSNYFRAFIQGYSTLVRPLINLTKKGVSWAWTDECRLAFEGVKSALISAPVLAQPDFSDSAPHFEVWCDASDFGTGAVLLQGGRVIAFHASSFHQAERNYTTGEKELLAVVRAMTAWRCYLEGGKAVKVMTDHAPNTYLPTQANLSRRQARWSEYLQRFSTLTWHYKPGRINVADPISRSPALQTNASAVDVAAQEWRDWLLRSQRGEGPATKRSVDSEEGRTLGVLLATRVAATLADAPAVPAGAPATNLLDRIRAAYVHDPYFQKLGSNPRDCQLEQGLWKQRATGAVLVPNDSKLRHSIIEEAHATSTCGHSGMNATLDRLRPWFLWEHGEQKMREQVESFVARCDSCQRNKSTNQKPGGLLQPLPVPEGAWLSIGVDFVTGLPVTAGNKHDMLMTVVDRFTKAVHLVPTYKNLTAEGCAILLFTHVYRLHGLPDSIVSDRDKLFTGKFFPALQKLLGTKQKMSTAYHPQTDGQTERANRVLQEVLRHVTCVAQDDWDEKLAAVELAINTATRRSLGKGISPFMLSHGREPRLPFNLDLPVPSLVLDAEGNITANVSSDTSQVPKAQQMFGHMSALMSVTRDALHTSVNRMKLQADKGRRDVGFQVDQEVLLSTKYLRARMSHGKKAVAPKLLPRYIGPFRVTAKVGPAACRLDLKGLECHPVFHVSLLKEYKSSGSYQPPQQPLPYQLDGDIVYNVERILDHRFVKRGRGAPKLQYLVKWEGYGAEHDSWEPEVNLRDAPEPLSRYADYLQTDGKTLIPSVVTAKSQRRMPASAPTAPARRHASDGQRKRGKRGGAANCYASDGLHQVGALSATEREASSRLNRRLTHRE